MQQEICYMCAHSFNSSVSIVYYVVEYGVWKDFSLGIRLSTKIRWSSIPQKTRLMWLLSALSACFLCNNLFMHWQILIKFNGGAKTSEILRYLKMSWKCEKAVICIGPIQLWDTDSWETALPILLWHRGTTAAIAVKWLTRPMSEEAGRVPEAVLWSVTVSVDKGGISSPSDVTVWTPMAELFRLLLTAESE